MTETWLNHTIPSSLLDPQNLYTVVRRDRSGAGNGGVCAFISKTIDVISAPLLDEYASLEICIFDAKQPTGTVRFIIVYRPPSSKCMPHIVDCVRHYTGTKIPYVIAGDFNCPGIDWYHLTAPNDSIQSEFLNFAICDGLHQVVNKPTRGVNILDLVLTNEPLMVCDTQVTQPFSNSDHNRVLFKLYFDAHPHNSQSCITKQYNWSSADFANIVCSLSAVNWYDVLAYNLTADSIWTAFCGILDRIIDDNVPSVTVAQSAPSSSLRVRYPAGIKRAIARKRCLWRQCKARPTDVKILTSYKLATKRCTQLIRNFEIRKEQRVIESNNAGSFYNFVNKKLTCKTGIGALRNSENAIITDDEQRANLLNEFFSSVCTIDNGIKPALNRAVANDVKIDSVTFTPAKVLHAIRKLKSSKSSGPDGYTAELLYSSFMSVAQMPSTMSPRYCNSCLQAWICR